MQYEEIIFTYTPRSIVITTILFAFGIYGMFRIFAVGYTHHPIMKHYTIELETGIKLIRKK